MSHTLRITILGCGSSGGVPRVGGDWGVCDPSNRKNRRSRCSILVEKWANTSLREGESAPPESERTIILVDTSPDLREQLQKRLFSIASTIVLKRQKGVFILQF